MEEVQHHTGLTKSLLKDVDFVIWSGSPARSLRYVSQITKIPDQLLVSMLYEFAPQNQSLSGADLNDIIPLAMRNQDNIYCHATFDEVKQRAKSNLELLNSISKKDLDKIVSLIPLKNHHERGLFFAVLKDQEFGFNYMVATSGMAPGSQEIALAEVLQTIKPTATMIRTGTGGTMKEDISVGDFVIATGYVSVDGTSRKYDLNRYDTTVQLATPEVMAALKTAATHSNYKESHGKNTVLGHNETKDALWWEIFVTPMAREAKRASERAREYNLAISSMEDATIAKMVDVYNRGKVFYDEATQKNEYRDISFGSLTLCVNSPKPAGEEALFDLSNPEIIETGEHYMQEIAVRAIQLLHQNKNQSQASQLVKPLLKEIEDASVFFELQAPKYTSEIKAIENLFHNEHSMWARKH